MADKKISALSSGTTPDGTESTVIVQGGATVKVLLSALLTYIQGAISIAQSQVSGLTAALSGKLAAASNLSDVANAAAARTNLGLGTAATQASTAFEASGVVSTHNNTTTSVHGIADTSKLQSYGRVTFSNADATVSAGTHYLAQIGTLSAARTVTLPAASAVPAGFELIVEDASRTITAANTITIQRAGSDTVDGGTSTVLNYPGQRTTLISDGVSAWTTAQSGSPLITDYTTTTTDTLPTGYTFVQWHVWGAGGGGGSGRRGAAGTNRAGGGGGGGGGYTLTPVFRIADLGGAGTSVTQTIGAAGVGGAAVTTDNTDGNAGSAGGGSIISITNKLTINAGGGTGGGGGTATTGTAGSGAGSALFSGSNGSAGSNSAGTVGNSSISAGSGGGGGGGLNTSDTTAAGGDARFGAIFIGGDGGTTPNIGGTAGGGNGSNATSSRAAALLPVSSGSGGGSNNAGAGGAGGNGGRGCGGGGGGGSQNGFASGKGGDGGPGYIRRHVM